METNAETTRRRWAKQLEQAAALLHQIASELDNENTEDLLRTPAVEHAVAEKLARRVCLQCGERIERTARRGCCMACYQTTSYRVKVKKEIGWGELIRAGLYTREDEAPPGRRKQTPLDQFIDTEKEARRLAGRLTEKAKSLGKRPRKKTNRKTTRKRT